MSSVWLLPVTSASQPHFFSCLEGHCKSLSSHQWEQNNSLWIFQRHFSYDQRNQTGLWCPFFFFTRSNDVRGLVWRWGGPDGPVLPWKCQGLFLLASPAFTCIIHPSSDVSCPYFKRRKVLTEKNVRGRGQNMQKLLLKAGVENHVTRHRYNLLYTVSGWNFVTTVHIKGYTYTPATC